MHIGNELLHFLQWFLSKKPMKKSSEILIYKDPKGSANIEVRLQQETLWLTQDQMAAVFQRDRSVISKHINKIFSDGELPKKSNVQKMHIAKSDKPVALYGLDVIISIGYKVNSKRGTEFRIWATRVLKDYLIRGYVVNEKKLRETTAELTDLRKVVKLMTHVIDHRELDSKEAKGLLQVIRDYTYALDVLDRYDHQTLEIENTRHNEVFKITYDEALGAIATLGEKSLVPGGRDRLFGKQKDESFQGSLNAIYQTFDGKDLYHSLEEKAAHLLYFIIKNHSFIDGNKRIAAFVFAWFLDRNHHLYAASGEKRIADNALVALCLMIAASDPAEKDIMIKVIVNLINKSN